MDFSSSHAIFFRVKMNPFYSILYWWLIFVIKPFCIEIKLKVNLPITLLKLSTNWIKITQLGPNFMGVQNGNVSILRCFGKMRRSLWNFMGNDRQTSRLLSENVNVGNTFFPSLKDTSFAFMLRLEKITPRIIFKVVKFFSQLLWTKIDWEYSICNGWNKNAAKLRVERN